MRYSRRSSGIYAAEAELPRGARGFLPPFGAPFAAPIATPGGAATAPWYLTTGVTAADVEAAYQMKGVASLAASYVNLNSPGTHDLFDGTAPTWDATNGQKYNGSSQYLKTDIVPDATQSWSMFLRYSNASGNTAMAGLYQDNVTPTAFGLGAHVTGDVQEYLNGSITALQVAPGLAGAVMGFAGATGYRNGTADAGAIPLYGSGSAVGTLYIGGYNYDNGAGVFFSAFYAQAWVIYNKVLNGTQAAAISTAMAAL